VLELRQEIASLQHDNELYRLKERHGPSDVSSNELRRLRLLVRRRTPQTSSTIPAGGRLYVIVEPRFRVGIVTSIEHNRIHAAAVYSAIN
jgi:hypothetical protein